MYSIHNHSTFCDGKSSVENMFKAACDIGLRYFGLSGHAPVPFTNKWSIKDDNELSLYLNAIDKIKQTSSRTLFFAGLEADFVPDIAHDFSYWLKNYKLDFLIGSVHLVKIKDELWFIDGPTEDYDKGLSKFFGNDMQLAVKTFYKQSCEMIETQKFDVLGHCDKIVMNNKGRFFSPESGFHTNLLKEMLCLAAEKDLIVEINTRGIYRNLHDDYYPGKYIFKFLKDKKIKIMLSADGHTTDQITAEYDSLKKTLKNIGFKETWLPNKISTNPTPL